jgi:hypothetical protein
MIPRKGYSNMRRHTALLIVLLVSAAAAACASAHGGDGSSTRAAEPPVEPVRDVGQTPVVIELFTSQGCSSCPPAERVLSRLGHDAKLQGRVVPLAFHVDYWDSLGWTDPFSSPDWSARQDEYSHALGLDGVYTPQAVVNGRTQLNGSDEGGILQAVASASREPGGQVTVAVAPDGTNRLAVDVTAETAAALGADSLDAVVVLYESGASTKVLRGENSGRQLENDFIVRRIGRAFSFKPSAGAKGQGRVTFDVDPKWNASNLGIAAFLQDRTSMRIFGAAVSR